MGPDDRRQFEGHALRHRRGSSRLLEQGSGHIINLSSVAGIKVFAPGGTVYSGTKFAVSAISEGLRQEVGEKVRVTSIEPGAVESDLKFTTSGYGCRDGAGLLQAGHPGGIGGACYRVRCRST